MHARFQTQWNDVMQMPYYRFQQLATSLFEFYERDHKTNSATNQDTKSANKLTKQATKQSHTKRPRMSAPKLQTPRFRR